MDVVAFSHLVFWKHPLPTLCFFALGLSFLSLWAHRAAWLWGSFLAIAFILALEAKIAAWFTLIPLSILLFCHYFLKQKIQRSTRFLLFGVATVISMALAFHFFPGFHNWKLASNQHISPGALPYSLWLNFDKPFIGIFALALGIPLLSSRAQVVRMLRTALPLSLAGIAILMGLSLFFGMIRWDPKIPTMALIWLMNNLVFVSIPEEAFFRGFMQREIYRWCNQHPLAAFASICIPSVFFSLVHLIWVADLSFLCLVFMASLIYGTIYQLTQSIEASILCHFGVNAVHFFLFTYPALRS